MAKQADPTDATPAMAISTEIASAQDSGARMMILSPGPGPASPATTHPKLGKAGGTPTARRTLVGIFSRISSDAAS
jgi:hypothetical protein